MITIVSQHIISRHPVSGKPKIVQIAYSNGRIDRVHCHNNGQQTRTTIREGTTSFARQVGQPTQPQGLVYQRVISRHSITNAPKVVECKYTNGRIVRFHHHNDGRITRETC